MSQKFIEPFAMRLPDLEGCDEGVLNDLFGQVARHLLTQKAKAKSPGGGCRYLDDAGLRCAVGCLIRPDVYNPTIEGCASDSTEVLHLLTLSGVPVVHRAVREVQKDGHNKERQGLSVVAIRRQSVEP